MDLPTIINVGISLIFIYLILSLLTSEVQEAIATWREWRAKHLKIAIGNILQNDNLTREVYDHALIKSLNQKNKNRSEVRPSYIPSDIFASVLLDILTLDFKSSHASKTVEAKINQTEPIPPELKAILSTFAKTDLTETQESDRAVRELHQQIASWFDDSMQRATGAYKRNAKGVSFLVGLFVAIVANADTIYLTQRFYKDEVLRNTVAQVSEEILTRNSEAIVKCLNLAKTESGKEKCLQPFKDNVDIALNNISSPPIGWYLADPLKQLQQQQGISSIPKWDWRGILKIVFGWLLTAVAISMGAPFWFEALNKLVNVRNTGNKPNSTTE